MRKILGACLLFLMLIPVCAFAQTELLVSADKIILGEWICASVLDGEGKTFVYSMEKDEKLLFEGLPTTADEGWYQPKETGVYRLSVVVTDEDGIAEELNCSFEVCAEPVCTVQLDAEEIALGGSVLVTAEVTGGTGDFTYDCAVLVGNACVDRVITKENVFSVMPACTGENRFVLTVTDHSGHTCTTETVLQVLEGAAVSVSGDTGAFHAAGGLRIVHVSAPGVWLAETDASFITLHRFCGTDGDELVFSVSENNGHGPREGVITLHCDEKDTEFSVYQTDTFPMEEEVYMEQVTDALFVEGDTLSAWHFAEGERLFRVEASAEWTATCDQDFVTLKEQAGGLAVALDPNDTDSIREATIVLTCGRAKAIVHISQMPVLQGANVKSARLDRKEGIAYHDQAMAFVVTSADTETLWISSDMWKAPLILQKSDAIQYGENELLWQAALPLRTSGEKQVLFEALGPTGKGEKQVVTVQIKGEAPAFEGTTPLANATEEGLQLDVLVTRSVQSVCLMDSGGFGFDECTADQVFVDYAPGGDAGGRYVMWRLMVPWDEEIAALQVGENSMKVVLPQDEPQPDFVLYSQQDTMWDDVQYRHSDLKTSGCAIFALSHALQLLDYGGEEILPQNLAKKYAFCLVEGGTLNSTLVGNAGKDLGFSTRYDLYESLPEIVDKTRQGAMWSFMVAKGHIAAVVGMSDDGKMFRIIDSAPSATFERTAPGTMYLQNADGTFAPIADLGDVPGSRYYLESSGYNGMEYWMTAEYVAKQGVRLIMPIDEE